jgi:hypothetical protein
MQRSRELVVEPSELQRLPATAMIVSYGAGPERQVLLADANPAIGALPAATLAALPGPAALPRQPAVGGRVVNLTVTETRADRARRPPVNG